MPCILNLGEIHHPVATLLAEQLEQVTVVFERQLASDLAAVNTLCAHIEQYRGKMLRPTVVLLSGLATGTPPCDEGVLTDKHRTVAAGAEMIHMATLDHDDVLDEAQVRRRGATVNHLWGNEPAVMLGDYLISNAFTSARPSTTHRSTSPSAPSPIPSARGSCSSFSIATTSGSTREHTSRSFAASRRR